MIQYGDVETEEKYNTFAEAEKRQQANIEVLVSELLTKMTAVPQPVHEQARYEIAKLTPSTDTIQLINKINEIINEFNKTLRSNSI